MAVSICRKQNSHRAAACNMMKRQENDHGSWICYDQEFFDVSMGYRFGLLSPMVHVALPSAIAGLLDQRLALTWVKKNIKALSENPLDITTSEVSWASPMEVWRSCRAWRYTMMTCKACSRGRFRFPCSAHTFRRSKIWPTAKPLCTVH